MKTEPYYDYPKLARFINVYNDESISNQQLISVVDHFVLTDINKLLKRARIEAVTAIDERYMDHTLTEAKVEELAFYIEVRAYDDGDSHRKYRAILQDLVDRDGEAIQVSYDDSDSKETLERKSWSAKDVYSLESDTPITFLTEEGINFLARECQYANEDEMRPENYLLIKLFRRLDEMNCKVFIFPM